ncbi:MAG: type V CRISPR-associated protein Cas12b, partial [Planctomycetota bacterium]
MRLAPPLGASKEDKARLWRKLWQTHDLVNRGTMVLGEVWLNLRGGLHASLAAEAPSPDDARVLLALGWLTVEAPASAIPPHAILARPDQDPKERSRVLGARLESILKADGIPSDQVPAWMEACRATLAAEMREDAVWVDRRGEFDRAAKTLGWTARVAREMLIDEMMDGIASYLAVDDSSGKSKKKKYGEKARNWISENWGTGDKSDTGAILTKLKSVLKIPLENFNNKSSQSLMSAIHEAVGAQGDPLGDTNNLLKQIKKTFAWKGRPSAGCMALNRIAENLVVTDSLTQQIKALFNKEINDKELKAGRANNNWSGLLKSQTEQATGLLFRTDKDNIGEYVVMLDHALRRVSIAHSWAKLAEASRRQFQEAATAPSDASVSAWVQGYALARAESSGSLGEYLIRRNALDGWKEVCQAWVNLGQEATVEKRIKAARDLQDEVDKFGDIQLFEALAEHPELWSRNGAARPELLAREVDRRIADNDRTRFKVPAYRHPDPLLNPVFCDYGNSRWKIWYSAQGGGKDQQPRTITLDTCADGTISETEFRWQSKRLFNEIVSGAEETIEGSRNHRHAYAIHADKPGQRIRTAGIFGLKDWKGRLQAPRASLERVHAMRARNADQGQIDKAMARIPWLVTFSAPLIPEGPWLDFVQDDPTLQGHKPVKDLAPREGYEFAGLSFPFVHPENGKTRKKAARIGLSRLKGLRILSADLGHRHAAACAVWRAIDLEELISRCATANSPAPAPDALFLHLREQGKTVVFRRLSADALPDGKPHPAPWAELERQFLIQLPGEESQPRYATVEERNEVARLESLMGCRLAREPKGWRMDRLQLDLVRSARLGLRRHGTMARLAIGLGSSERIMPGGRRVPFSGREDKEAHLADLLLQQHRLLMDELFPDEVARDRWKRIAGGYLTEAELSGGEPGARRDTRGLAKRLRGLASKFADGVPAATEWISYWNERWQAMDGVWRDVIRGIRNILMPKGGKADKSIRRRGGLSMSRITAIEEFRRKVQLAYHNRQRLDGERAEAPEGFAAKALRSL